MLLSDIFEQLTYGELNQFSMGGSEGQEVRPEDYRRVIAHVNLGLTELHKRFFLRSRQIMVQMYDHISTYVLDKRYAQSNELSEELYRYIMDSKENPFNNDLMRIEEVYDETGCKICLNDLNAVYPSPFTEEGQACSFFTPTYNSIQVPLPYNQSAFSVQYRADHIKIEYSPGIDPTKVQIELPNGLLEALLIYVGGRATAVVPSDGGQEGMSYLQKFDASCKRAEDLGLQIVPQYTNFKFDYRGWV